jgi:hypothetical protein
MGTMNHGPLTRATIFFSGPWFPPCFFTSVSDDENEFPGFCNILCHHFSLKFDILKSMVKISFYKPLKYANLNHNFLKSHHDLYFFHVAVKIMPQFF